MSRSSFLLIYTIETLFPSLYRARRKLLSVSGYCKTPPNNSTCPCVEIFFQATYTWTMTPLRSYCSSMSMPLSTRALSPEEKAKLAINKCSWRCFGEDVLRVLWWNSNPSTPTSLLPSEMVILFVLHHCLQCILASWHDDVSICFNTFHGWIMK